MAKPLPDDRELLRIIVSECSAWLAVAKVRLLAFYAPGLGEAGENAANQGMLAAPLPETAIPFTEFPWGEDGTEWAWHQFPAGPCAEFWGLVVASVQKTQRAALDKLSPTESSTPTEARNRLCFDLRKAGRSDKEIRLAVQTTPGVALLGSARNAVQRAADTHAKLLGLEPFRRRPRKANDDK